MNLHLDVVGKLSKINLNVQIAKSNSVNVYFANFNISESYCGSKWSASLELIKSLFGLVKPDLLPECPLEGQIGAVNFTVDSSIVEYYPLYLPSGKHYLRMEFFTEKMESIFFGKLFFIINNIRKFNVEIPVSDTR
jgi:hypothetical protein